MTIGLPYTGVIRYGGVSPVCEDQEVSCSRVGVQEVSGKVLTVKNYPQVCLTPGVSKSSRAGGSTAR